MKLIATKNLKIKFDNVAPGGTVYAGDLSVDQISVMTTESAKTKIDNNAIALVNISYTFTAALPCPHTLAAHTFVAGGGTTLASAVKTKDDNRAVMRIDDAGNCVGSFTNNASGAVVPCSCTVKVSEAGQDGKVSCD